MAQGQADVSGCRHDLVSIGMHPKTETKDRSLLGTEIPIHKPTLCLLTARARPLRMGAQHSPLDTLHYSVTFRNFVGKDELKQSTR